jgi:hypothetical protein
MTAREAIEKGIRLVRLPHWNPWTYLELPPRLPDGTHGPWANLYDPVSSSIPTNPPAFPLPILFPDWDDDDDRLVEFTGPRLTPEDIIAGRHLGK